ncbi:MAG: hypothetical protein ACD_7C00047G0005 [uncultured bacterium]|nr:MAG: hypothetical protein ACD_7C00047G0005 [uncultured bacterium]HBR79775.1 hypothetical protein [Candidatus Moranbacteria bacterium]
MKNKKLIIISIGAIVLIVAVWGAWKMLSTQKPIAKQSTPVEYKELTPEDKQSTTQWKNYTNDLYKYQLSYPNNWNVFDSEAKTDFTELILGENETAKQGGAVFFSNKDNINYTQENKPDDFLLLGLMIYEKEATNLDNFAKLLGFTEEVQSSSIIFKADNVEGKEYISMGVTDANPRIAIIFKKDNTFYVFHLGFVGDNQENLKTMEKMVGSFNL